MKILTADQMRSADRAAIQEHGIPGAVLMENAGAAVAAEAARVLAASGSRRAAVLCGGGNNGGDGFVAARHLALAGAEVEIGLAADAVGLKGEAKTHYDAVRGMGVVIRQLADRDSAASVCSGAGVVVDALLGTGIKSAPRPPIAEAIAAINACAVPVVAVDIPSGIDADTGAAPGAAVHAACTITFGCPKLGLLLYPGADFAGEIHLSDIGFPWDEIDVGPAVELLESALARVPRVGAVAQLGGGPAPCAAAVRRAWELLLRPREGESNKGDYGHVAVVGGSRGMAGAPSMVARAAQRAGAGLVTVLAPECIQLTIAAKLNEEMTLPLRDADGALAEAAFDGIADFAAKSTVVCLGPGMTTAPGAAALVRRVVAELDRPIVVDADGLNALAQQPDAANRRTAAGLPPLLLTPHPGEAARLLGTTIQAVQSDRIAAVRELARRYGAVSVLKGRHTLIASPSGAVVLNTSGNPGMATGGMGDTLTGIAGGLWAQALGRSRHLQPIDQIDAAFGAAALAVHVHGIGGDIAAQQHGPVGFAAGDVADAIPGALGRLIGTLQNALR